MRASSRWIGCVGAAGALCVALAASTFAAAVKAQRPTAVAASSSAVAPPLELVVLGSGGPGATGRAGSSYLVLVDGVPRILVDAGPGSFGRLGEARLSLAKTDIVLLTHLHIDHAGELPGLFKARAVAGRRAAGSAGIRTRWNRLWLCSFDARA